MITPSGASARALLRGGLRLEETATDRFLVLSVGPWETKTPEESHTSAPCLGDVDPPVGYLLTMS